MNGPCPSKSFSRTPLESLTGQNHSCCHCTMIVWCARSWIAIFQLAENHYCFKLLLAAQERLKDWRTALNNILSRYIQSLQHTRNIDAYTRCGEKNILWPVTVFRLATTQTENQVQCWFLLDIVILNFEYGRPPTACEQKSSVADLEECQCIVCDWISKYSRFQGSGFKLVTVIKMLTVVSLHHAEKFGEPKRKRANCFKFWLVKTFCDVLQLPIEKAFNTGQCIGSIVSICRNGNKTAGGHSSRLQRSKVRQRERNQ